MTFETRKPIFDEYQALIKDVTPMAYLYTSNSLMAFNKRMVVDNINNFNVLKLVHLDLESSVNSGMGRRAKRGAPSRNIKKAGRPSGDHAKLLSC